MNLEPDCTLNYTVGHEAWYWGSDSQRKRYVRVGSDSNGGGCAWEFMIEEHVFTSHESALRVGMFDDAWAAYNQVPELFAALAAERPKTFDDLVELLERIGAKDDTPRAAPDGYLPPVELSRDRLGELLEQAAQLGIDAPAPVDLTAKGIAGTLLAEQLRGGPTPKEQQ